jgi:hypothetical protein
MATEIARPNGEGNVTEWNIGDNTSIDEVVTSPDDPTDPTWDPGNFFTSPYALLESISTGQTQTHEITMGNTSYSNVSDIEIFAYCGASGGGAVPNGTPISVDANNINDEQTLAAGGSAEGWYSHKWSGSWTQAQVNAMEFAFICKATGWGQVGIAAAYVEYTEEAAAGALTVDVSDSLNAAQTLD